ncbi:MAG: prepilin-type N-terminal cleavage/methylation domain-containing protein [Candidatus Peregrinibacteria bacterium]
MKQSKSFTLIEVLVSIGIVGAISGVAITAYRSYQLNNDLSMATQLVNQGITRAQFLSMTGSQDSPWGYDVATGTIFQGETYAGRIVALDEIYPLPPSISVAGLNTVSYSRMYGQPSTEGVIVLISQGGNQSTISVTATGVPPINESDLLTICHRNADGSLITVNIALAQWPAASVAGDTRGACALVQSSSAFSAASSLESSAESSVAGGAGGTTLPFSQKPGFLLLEPSAIALNISGNSIVQVKNNGLITINSANAKAVTISSNASLTCGSVSIVGNPGTSIAENAKIVGTIYSGISAVSDPLVSLDTPTKGIVNKSINKTGNVSTTIDPGTYTSISVSGNASVKLNPGIYYLVNGISLSGNGNVTGSGVMIYSPTGVFDLSGNGNITLTAPSSGTYKGIVVYQSRTAPSTTFSVGGNGTVNITGIVYAPKASFDIFGNGTNIVGSEIIGNNATVSGNGKFITQ